MYEKMFSRINDAIREGDTIARPMKQYCVPTFHPVTLFFFCVTLALPPLAVLFVDTKFLFETLYASFALAVLGGLFYVAYFKRPVVEDLVINMVDVGEETGELDVMLYKVADYYDEEVRTLTDGMMKLIEPVMIIVLGLIVLFIVVALFMPLIGLISGLQGG